MVVTMRPIPEAQVQLVGELTARYPHAHGRPIHAGDPTTATRSPFIETRCRSSGPAG
jgi:uncharacterized protein YcsI (UPF0317 family)